jgi:hypothetical protein
MGSNFTVQERESPQNSGADPTLSETQEIALASQVLSALLREFDEGSPAWKEARRQGEDLMRKMDSRRWSEKKYVEAYLERLSKRQAEAIEPSDQP